MNKILIKISGEWFRDGEKAVCGKKFSAFADSIIRLTNFFKVFVSIGGGNICRGRDLPEDEIDSDIADLAGMAATKVNAIVLKGHLKKKSSTIDRVHSRIVAPCEDKKSQIYQQLPEEIEEWMAKENRTVVILAGGTGLTCFTTDTATIQLAREMKIPLIIKATKIGGVFSDDPKVVKDAMFIQKISCQEIMKTPEKFKVMDTTAFTMMMDSPREMKLFITHPELVGQITRDLPEKHPNGIKGTLITQN